MGDFFDPTGVLRRWNPSVTSLVMISPFCLLMEWEYFCKQLRMSCAVVGVAASSSGRIWCGYMMFGYVFSEG